MAEVMFERATPLLEAELGNELLALDPARGLCFGFNEVAAAAWRLLDRPRTASDLADRLMEQFDVQPDQCRGEINELLDDLVTRGLLNRKSPGSPNQT